MAAHPVIAAEALGRRLSGLDAIGAGVASAAVNRLAWTPEDAACREWFAAQASEVGLRVSRDPAGNMWATPAADPPWWGVGSHLDSVLGGGRFDGPLGVVCGFEIAAAVPDVPVAVVSFADEEGARWGTPTFGSKALAARLDLPRVLERRDDAGVRLGDAMRAFGVNPDRLGEAPRALSRLAAFVEIHIDQTTELARAGQPVGVVTGLVARRRLEVTVRGRADHAGTTPRSERRDALGAAARLIAAAEDLSAERERLTVTTARILAEPNAPTTIARLVRMWVDARSPDEDELEGWQSDVEGYARDLATRCRVEVDVVVASRTGRVTFDEPLRLALRRAGVELLGDLVPELTCYAGHDAGVVADVVPAAMVFVRNPSGVSHAPEEHVELEDAAVAARVVARALPGLAAPARGSGG